MCLKESSAITHLLQAVEKYVYDLGAELIWPGGNQPSSFFGAGLDPGFNTSETYRIAGNIGENFIWWFCVMWSKSDIGVFFYLAVAESTWSSLLGYVVVMLFTTFVQAWGLLFQYTFHFLVCTLEFLICKRCDLWWTNHRVTSFEVTKHGKSLIRFCTRVQGNSKTANLPNSIPHQYFCLYGSSL